MKSVARFGFEKKKNKTFHFVDINTADKEKETEVEQQTTSA